MGSYPITRAAVDDAVRYADRWLAFRQRATPVPGVQAAVWFDGELVLSTAHGVADEASGEALTAAHRFRLASHSKTMTATVLAQMVEEGHLRLDDPVGTRLDWLHDSDSPVADLTLFQLLAHAGGIPRDSASSAHWQHEAPFLDADTLAERVLAEGTVTGADVRFKYSNIGYALLGQVIEAVTGRSWAEEVQERILDPLRLADTGPDWTPDVDGPWATGHTGLAWADRRVPIDQVPTNAMAAATGVWSTAADLCTYMAAHLPGDERLLTDASKRRLQRPVQQVEGVPDGGYGLGFITSRIAGRSGVGHNGGWAGHITSTVALPEDGLVVSVLTNAIDGPAPELVEGIIRLVDAAAAPVDGPVDDARARAPEGRYAWLWGVRDVAVLGGRAYLLSPTVPNPVAATVRLEPDADDPDRWVMVEGPGYASVGEAVTVERDADGRVEALDMSGTRIVPIDRAVLPDRVTAPGS